MGTNPLPIYLVGKYLIENSKSNVIYLIYSEKTDYNNSTKDYAERIIKTLNKLDSSIKFRYIPMKNIYNPGSKLDLNLYVTNDTNRICHLDITGGNKVMSYILNKELKNIYNDVVISYLDPYSQHLKFSDNNDVSLTEYDITLENLLFLHNYKMRSKIEPDEKNINYTNNIIKIFDRNENEFKEIKKYIEDYYNKSKDSKIIEYLKDKNLIPNSNTKEYTQIVKIIKKLLDGTWFEVYVYEIISDIINEEKDKIKHHELKYSAEISKINDNEGNKYFEIDILLLINHKLTAISVTTSTNESKNKNKVFEVIYRAKQISGDEANAIFITTYDFKKETKESSFLKFKNDLENDLNFDRRVLIESFTDLLKNRDNYKNQLKDFLFRRNH